MKNRNRVKIKNLVSGWYLSVSKATGSKFISTINIETKDERFVLNIGAGCLVEPFIIPYELKRFKRYKATEQEIAHAKSSFEAGEYLPFEDFEQEMNFSLEEKYPVFVNNEKFLFEKIKEQTKRIDSLEKVTEGYPKKDPAPLFDKLMKEAKENLDRKKDSEFIAPEYMVEEEYYSAWIGSGELAGYFKCLSFDKEKIIHKECLDFKRNYYQNGNKYDYFRFRIFRFKKLTEEQKSHLLLAKEQDRFISVREFEQTKRNREIARIFNEEYGNFKDKSDERKDKEQQVRAIVNRAIWVNESAKTIATSDLMKLL